MSEPAGVEAPVEEEKKLTWKDRLRYAWQELSKWYAMAVLVLLSMHFLLWAGGISLGMLIVLSTTAVVAAIFSLKE